MTHHYLVSFPLNGEPTTRELWDTSTDHTELQGVVAHVYGVPTHTISIKEVP